MGHPILAAHCRHLQGHIIATSRKYKRKRSRVVTFNLYIVCWLSPKIARSLYKTNVLAIYTMHWRIKICVFGLTVRELSNWNTCALTCMETAESSKTVAIYSENKSFTLYQKHYCLSLAVFIMFSKQSLGINSFFHGCIFWAVVDLEILKRVSNLVKS